MTGAIVRLLAALTAGVGAWCSLGTLAVAQTGGRIGLLPSIPSLLAAVGIALAVVFGLRWAASRCLPLLAAVVFVLPWIPGTTVPAFLIFTGPVAWLWWGLIGVGCLVAGPIPAPAAVTGLLRDPRRAPWVAGALVAVVSSLAAVNIQEWLPGGDEPHYLVITQSLMRDGDLQIENNHKNGDYLAYYPSELPPDYLRRGTNRQIYSIHAPGLSALVIPAFALGGYAGVVAFLIVCGAIGAGLAWSLGHRLTADPGAAWAGWAVVATSTTYVAHNFMIFPDGLSGVCVMAGLLALFVRPDASTWRFAGLSVVTALLPWLHTRNAPVALVVGLAGAWPLLRARTWRSLAAWMTPLALSALGWLGFFKVIYGAFDPSAPYGGYTQSGLANLPRGLLGLLFDQQFGLLAHAPALAVGIVGVAIMAWPSRIVGTPREGHPVQVSPRMLSLVLVAVVVPYTLLAASYAMWWGGASAPARFLTPIVLPLALPAAVTWQRCTSRAARGVVLGLVAVSAVILFAVLSQQRGIMAFNSRDGFALLADWASPVADLSQALPAVHRDPADVVAWRALLWIAVPVACLCVGWLVARTANRSRGAIALAMIGTAACGAGVAANSAWTLRSVDGRRADASQVRLSSALSRASAGAVPVVFRDAPRNDGFGRTERSTKRVQASDLAQRLAFSTSLRRAPRYTAFGAGLLPAGRYRLRVATRDAAAGPVDVAIGRDGAPLRQFSWDRPDGPASATTDIDLAMPVRLVTVRGEARATEAVSSVVMQVLEIRPRDPRLGTENVERLARFGSSLVYLLSDALYVERDGMWIRPAVDVPMVVARDEAPTSGPLLVLVHNGPIANDVVLTGTTTVQVSLGPDEERIVPLDVTWVNGAARFSVRAAHGFRPREVDPSSTDPRLLGAWIAFR